MSILKREQEKRNQTPVGYGRKNQRLVRVNDLNSHECLAKKIGQIYYIRYNPSRRSFYDLGADMPKIKYDTIFGRCNYNFVEVNRDTFKLYIKFLSTGDVGFLNEANRSGTLV